VWLVRRDDDRVDAYSGTCPHLGCSVNYEGADSTFLCPCHHAVFARDGSKVSGPQLRGLDALPSTIEQRGGEEWVSVVYERFELGIPEKIQVG
jgi:Rieske Fe-S protein